jgi:hypothetical protein
VIGTKRPMKQNGKRAIGRARGNETTSSNNLGVYSQGFLRMDEGSCEP